MNKYFVYLVRHDPETQNALVIKADEVQSGSSWLTFVRFATPGANTGQRDTVAQFNWANIAGYTKESA